MRTFIIVLVSTFLLFGFSYENNQQPKPVKIILSMFDSIKKIHTLRTRIYALERLGKQYVSAISEIKIQTHPRKVYFINPSKKLEILYNAEVSTKATVKPHVFPYLTLNLDPTGNMMRKNQHYTINELGFAFISTAISLTINNDKDAINHFVYHGKVLKNGYSCYMIEYDNPSYEYRSYAVIEKETASSIAFKLCVNDYLLRQKNDLLNDFGYLRKGTILTVPSQFCKKAVIYVDEKLMVPVSISLSDEIGLFESYSFSFISINKAFRPEEFSINNKEYGF